jgi:predicted nucleic acid-binding protein
MTEIVLDASAVLKWILVEEEGDLSEVRKLQKKIRGGELRVLVPEILFTEVINVLYWKKFAKEKILEFLQVLRDGRFAVEPMDRFGDEELLEIMEEYNVTVYDAYYVVLAERNRCKLLSFDKKLKDIYIRK